MEEAPGKSAYSILKAIEEKYNIRNSTFKLNARSLRRIGLIDFCKGKNAELTINGRVILSVIKNREVENGK